MADDITHRTVLSNWVQLHIIQSGPPDGAPVVLLHGFPEFWYGWKEQIAPLAGAGFRTIVPDQRGYNRSDKPRGLSAYRLDILAQDVAGLLEALGYRRATVVGHDWGGIVAWALAALYPERVEKLAVINAPYPPVSLRTLPRHPEQLLRSAYMFFFQLNGLAEAVMRADNWAALVESLRRTSRPGTFSAADFERYREAWWRKGAMTGMLSWYRAMFRRPYRLPLRPPLQMPVLILWGAQDVALGRELAEASVALCPLGRLEFFEEATHWVQHEEAEQVNARLIDFARGS